MEQDRIERDITIEAPRERVWAMVSEPGWWVGDGGPGRDQQQRSREGELYVVDDPTYGRFPIEVVSSRPPGYICYRWVPSQGSAADEGGTLVEFWLDEQDGATVVRVAESGFASLSLSEQERRSKIEGNAHGWEHQLAVLRRDTTAVRQ